MEIRYTTIHTVVLASSKGISQSLDEEVERFSDWDICSDWYLIFLGKDYLPGL